MCAIRGMLGEIKEEDAQEQSPFFIVMFLVCRPLYHAIICRSTIVSSEP